MNYEFDTTEMGLPKAATSFADYQYDAEETNTLLSEASQLIDTVCADVEEITNNYAKYQAMYAKFTDLNEAMDSNSRDLRTYANNIKEEIQKLIAGLGGEMEEAQADDASSIAAMEAINSQLTALDNGTGDAPTGTSTTPTATTPTTDVTTPAVDTTVTTPQVDLASVADQVIAGMYGTGPDRVAALTAAGYDAQAVQAIVNAKMKGTWTGNTTVVTPTVPTTPAVETPSVPTTPTVPTTPAVTTPTTPAVTTPTDNTTESGFIGGGIANSFVQAATNFLGTKYKYGGNGGNGIDCSGLVQQAAAAIGVSLPRSTGSLINTGTSVSRNNVQPGDLVFTNGGQHVQIVTGINSDGSLNVIGSSSVAGYVKTQKVNSGIVAIRRVV